MFLEDINAIVVGGAPYNFIQQAVTAAATAPNKWVIIPPTYSGTDTFTNPSNVFVFDLRVGTANKGSYIPSLATVNTNAVRAVSAPAASAVTAAVGGVFATSGGTQITNLLPGSSAFEQVPFTVKAGGFITLPIGTYTCTLQPLLYASTVTSPAFTAAAANAIYSAAAAGCTIASASAITVPWEIEAHLIGDTVSGKIAGWNQGVLPVTGATLATTIISPTTISNAPTSVTLTAAASGLAFAMGYTIAGTAGTGASINLGSFFINQA